LNKAALARDVGISPSTSNHWLSMLEASGQVALLEPWFSNRTKSIVKSPKLYFADAVYFARCSIFAPKKPYASRPPLAQYGRPFVFAQLRDRECRVGREG